MPISMWKESEMKGILEEAQEAGKNFYEMGIDVENIAQGAGYAVEIVKS